MKIWLALAALACTISAADAQTAIGDVVYLKSGGRPMVVVQVHPPREDGVPYVTVQWDGGSMSLPAAALTVTDPSPMINSSRDDENQRVQALRPAPVAAPAEASPP